MTVIIAHSPTHPLINNTPLDGMSLNQITIANERMKAILAIPIVMQYNLLLAGLFAILLNLANFSIILSGFIGKR